MNIRISEEIEVEVWQVERPPEIKPPKKDAFNLKFTKHIKTRSTSLNLFVESHHHLSINTDTLQIKSVAAYMKRYLCVCIPWLCFYVFVCAGVCFKASGGKQKKEMGKKSYKRKEIKNYKVCSNIQEPHSCSCREGSVRTCVSNITARAANETKERSKRCVITRLFYLLGFFDKWTSQVCPDPRSTPESVQLLNHEKEILLSFSRLTHTQEERVDTQF